MSRQKVEPPYQPVTVEFENRNYTAGYWVESELVTVRSWDYGEKSTPIAGSTGILVARTLLKEILAGAKAIGQLK